MNKITFLAGPRYLLRGFRLVARPGLRRFVLIPLSINTALFGALIVYGVGQFDALIETLLPPSFDWLEWLLWPLFAVTVLLVAFYAFGLIANLIAAPFNSLLAAAVERELTGKRPDDSGGGLRAAFMSFGHELKKFLFLIGCAVPLLILFVIPVLNLLAPLAWFLFSAWLLALEYSDYPLGNRGLHFPEIRARVRQRPLLALSFGASVLVCTLIPLLNFLVMPAAVAGATAWWLDEFADRRERSH